MLVSNRKTIGTAPAVCGSSLLLHGAVARADRRSSLARFRLASAPGEPAIPGAELPAADRLGLAILATWQADGAAPVSTSLIEWAEAASQTYRARFDDPDWTWRR